MLVHTTVGDIEEPIYNITNYPYSDILSYPTVRNKHATTYINVPAAFDIETTNIYCRLKDTCTTRYNSPDCKKCEHYFRPYAFMYHWQICIGEAVIFGRTWEEFKEFIYTLVKKLELSNRKRIIIYVHNLAFEFQFIRTILPIKSIFARQKRKVIKADTGIGIEFRCSYTLSNMSLAKFCENSNNVIHCKEVGTYDYDKIRTTTTPLTVDELSYCYNDVRGLCECIADKLKEDDISTIPLTSTGYVRRDFRKAMKKNRKNKENQRKWALDRDLYIELKEAFRGGNTHANAYYVGEVLEGVISYDRASSYPHVMMVNKYPSKFIAVEPDLSKYENQSDYAFLVRIRLYNVRHKLDYGIPYIDIAHCRYLGDHVNDNGRILTADHLEITITDIDWAIIKDTYDFDKVYAADMYIAKYQYLPTEYREEIADYFYQKTTLKGVTGKEYEYMKSKNRLNSAYGMMVTDIANDEVLYEEGEWTKHETDIDKALEKYYRSEQTFLSYQWGVWVTAHARAALQEAINLCGNDIVYVDTDSVKVIGDEYHELFKKLNAEITELNSSSPLPPVVEYKGKQIAMGIWDYEGTYEEFKTLGSKCYCTKKAGKPYETTVAGLGKKQGADFINGHSIEAFEVGTIIKKSGRTESVYNDDEQPHEIAINGDTFTTSTNLAIVSTSYTFGITDEYYELLGGRNKKL